MNKFVSLLIVLLAIAVATPVIAEERLSLSGQMRVRGFHQESRFNDDVGANNVLNQRLRIAGKMSVAEGVSVNFRIDVSDKTWGADEVAGTDTTHMGTDGDNLAFINVDKGMFNLRAGRLWYGIGNNIAIDHIAEGAVFTLKGAVPVEIGAFKGAENTGNKDDDADIYTLAVKHSTDMYNAVVFGGLYRAGDADGLSSGKDEIYLVGVQTAMKLDPINLNFELNYFTGERDVPAPNDFDYKGLQAYLDANMAISETVTAGASLFYSQGQDDDVMVTNFTNDGSFMPETYSFMQLQYNLFPTNAAGVTPFGNTSLNTTFDPSGDQKGVIGAQVYGQFKVMDDLTLRANVGYWQMEDDYSAAEKTVGNADYDATAYDSFITVIGSARYALAAKTNLDVVAGYTIPDGAHSNVQDDENLLLAFNLNVNF